MYCSPHCVSVIIVPILVVFADKDLHKCIVCVIEVRYFLFVCLFCLIALCDGMHLTVSFFFSICPEMGKNVS